VSLFVVPEVVLDEEFDVSDFVLDSLFPSDFFSSDGPVEPADPVSLDDFFA
jgi:hypothetical protein